MQDNSTYYDCWITLQSALKISSLGVARLRLLIGFIADKFHNLYNSVSYNEADMDILKNDIDNMINVQRTRSSHCTHETHSIIANDVMAAIKKLKHDKKDGCV